MQTPPLCTVQTFSATHNVDYNAYNHHELGLGGAIHTESSERERERERQCKIIDRQDTGLVSWQEGLQSGLSRVT